MAKKIDMVQRTAKKNGEENRDYVILLIKKDQRVYGGQNRLPYNMTMAEELDRFMDIMTPYRTWMKRMINNDFEEGVDYQILVNKNVRQDWGGHNRLEHAVTVHMAKELSMIQNNVQSKLARKYFISMEEKVLELLHRSSTALGNRCVST